MITRTPLLSLSLVLVCTALRWGISKSLGHKSSIAVAKRSVSIAAAVFAQSREAKRVETVTGEASAAFAQR